MKLLEVDVARPLGALRLEARFEAAGGVTALFGRSGAGKSSVVNCIAGLLRPERGRIALDGRVLFDAGRRIDVPRHRRRVGYVFQDARLFPHLTVRRNLLYGRWFTPRAERTGSLDEVVDLLGVGPLLDRRPGALSGGERQRVAIGRALLASPRLLLLDEPLASLDDERKAEILPWLERLRDRARVPIVYVSHSVDEVARLADTLVLMEAGRVAASGPVAEVMGRIGRADGFEAGALLTARVARHLPDRRLTVLDHAAGELRVPGVEAAEGARVRLRVRARDVALALSPVAGTSIRNQLPATVRALEPDPAGPDVAVRLDIGGEALLARVTAEAAAELGLAPGLAVTALVKGVALDRVR